VQEVDAQSIAILMKRRGENLYSVVYWTKEGNYLNIAQNKDDSVWIANTIKEADAKAEEIEKQSGVEDARTISLESISE
jgi:hypothetical protein